MMAELRGWFEQSPGRDLAELERACLGRLLPDLFGYYLLQVGLLGVYGRVLELSRVRHQILLGEEVTASAGTPRTVGEPTRLPVATDSVDVVLLPHTLEFADDPRDALREADRVLIPEGRVIILGFNAWSLWGLRRALDRSGAVPWCGKFVSPFRAAEWLSILGFDVEHREYLMFRPPSTRANLMRRLALLDRAGRALWPALAGVYAIRAVKRVSTLTPLRPSWSVRARVVAGRAVEPTTRT